MLIAGIDAGNNKIALSLPNMKGKDAIIVPTVYAPYSDYDNGLSNKKKDLIDSLDVDITLNANNKEQRKQLGRFFVGNMARETEGVNAIKREMGRVKTGDEGLFICSLTTLAYGAVVSQNKHEGRITQEYSIVTGLPFAQYKDHKSREEYQNQFKGKHLVKFGGNYSIEVELVITGVNVDCEGAGAMKKSILKEDGEFKYPPVELVDRILMGYDLGEFTGEVIAIKFVEENGEVVPEYVPKLCSGIDKGIANAKQPIIDYLREKHNTIIDRYVIDKVCKRNLRRGEIDLESGGTFNILSMYESELDRLAQSCDEIINNKVKSSGEKGKILGITLFGGGPCALENKMGNFTREDLEDNLDLKPNKDGEPKVVIADNAVTANSDGYLEQALVIFDSGDNN